ncbi:MAG TPA: hypothetical protein H9881_03310 [Candidatus Stackebrandtia excrementipullorum]|nr:hypothetical protein [Candidatus Stackebrandtia excrementipullorum]
MGTGETPRGTAPTEFELPGIAQRSPELPSLGELRRGPAALSALDRVLYGSAEDSASRSEASRTRRDIVAVSLRIVALATHDEADLVSAVPVHDPDDRLWTDRFGELVESVDCTVDEAGIAAKTLAQCASAPSGLDRVIAVMATSATADLVEIAGLTRAIRSHMVEAAVCADMAWCAAHGQLAECPSWRRSEREGEAAVLVRLQRFLPPKTKIISTTDSDLGDLAAAVGFAASHPQEVSVPVALIELVDRLLSDGRWATPSQRRIVTEARRRLTG